MKQILALGLAAALAACSSLGSETAPGCDGARRPANPNGSVLAPAAPPDPSRTTAPAVTGGSCAGARR